MGRKPTKALIPLLRTVEPFEFNQAVRVGRNNAMRLTGADHAGSTVEFVAKFSAGCERGVGGLVCEVIAACLAGDLGLPVLEPLLVRWTPAWANTITDSGRREIVLRSEAVAFGSRQVSTGFAEWTGQQITAGLIPTALGVFVFDALISNIDRRDSNRNCFFDGTAIRIFDHDLAFVHEGVVGWKSPWRLGALNALATPGAHIFGQGLTGKALDFSPLRKRWAAISDQRLVAYLSALPQEWSAGRAVAHDAIEQIRDARDHIDDCLSEVKRVLT